MKVEIYNMIADLKENIAMIIGARYNVVFHMLEESYLIDST